MGEAVGGGGGFDEDYYDPNSSTTTTTCFHKFRYDVFISFRGEDTRHGFTQKLLDALKEKEIPTFFDEEGLERGDEIHKSLLIAIEDSATCVAVISPRYADSRWCLEELSNILDSPHHRLIFPVFYGGVDPSSHVQDLNGTFGEHFRILEQKYCHVPDKVLRWKKSIKQVGEISGWDSTKWEKPTKDFINLSDRVVNFTGRLPLALEVLGTFFFDKKKIKEWEDVVEELKQIRPGNLHDLLMISFNALDEQEKCIFLDIACFFVDMDMERDNAIDILKGCGFNAEIAIKVLMTRYLIKIVGNKLQMHDELRDMGRQLVLEKIPAGMRTRLWNHDEIIDVLQYEKGTRTIEGIILSLEKNNTPSHSQIIHSKKNSASSNFLANWKNFFRPGSEIETGEVLVHTKAFAPMSYLRLLQINHLKLEGTFKFIPPELKLLEWKNCSLETLPSDFCLSELAVLDLSESKIKQVWPHTCLTRKMAEKLTVLNLSRCYNLTATPDFSGLPFLEKLTLELCTGLVEIHTSIGDVKTLLTLNLKDCSNLVEFPNDISGLRKLENFVLSGCSKLKELPRDLSSLKSLLNLLADGTAIRKLPDSIFRLTMLKRLSLNGCTSLKELPHTIGRLHSLTELSLNDSAIEAIPDSIGKLFNLEILSIMRCRSITTIPDSIGNLKLLVELLLDGNTFKELPNSKSLLSRLKHFSLGSQSLEQLSASIGD